jgi:hypothetical protein
MSFISTYTFRTEVSKPALLDFIAKTPPEYFYFLVPGGPYVYGMFLTDDVVEYFINEFPVQTFEIVQAAVLNEILSQPGCKVWGNRELLSFQER